MSKRPHERAIEAIRYKRDRLEEAWNARTRAIRDNPNRMNIRGVWQADQLADLMRIHTAFVALDSALRDVESASKPRRRGKKVRGR